MIFLSTISVPIGSTCKSAVSCSNYPNSKCEFPDQQDAEKQKICQCDNDKGYTYNNVTMTCDCTISGLNCTP